MENFYMKRSAIIYSKYPKKSRDENLISFQDNTSTAVSTKRTGR